MDKLKEMMEKREALLKEFKELNEKRDFEAADTKFEEIRLIENEIKLEKANSSFEKRSEEEEEDQEEREISLAEEIRNAIESNKEIDISEIEVRDMGMTTPAAGGNKSVGNLGKQTFASYILKRLPNICRLYAAVRKEPLSGASHSIPVQKTKLGKFVNVKEFAEYVKDNADYDQIKLEPNKYGLLVVLSEEALEDTGYNVEADVISQIEESYAETIESLIVKGDTPVGVQGLQSFTESDGAHKVVQTTTGEITPDEILDIYKALPRKYRKNATWVFNDETAQTLSKLVDTNNRPLLFTSYNGEPFGDGCMLLGRPVIVSDECDGLSGTGNKGIFFGDLDRAIIVGPRKTMTIKKSDEVGFLNDTKAIKANTRLDIKKAIGEAMAYYECI